MENKLALRNQGISLFDDFFFNDFFNNNWLKKIDWDYSAEPAHYFFDEENKQMVITVQAPGFSKEDIQIDIDATGITIEGELKNEELKKRIGEKKFSYKMRKFGIDSKSVEAKLQDGILEIKFKSQESKTQKRITIQ
jgi:HSP20 family molecular chaperone IbpA